MQYCNLPLLLCSTISYYISLSTATKTFSLLHCSFFIFLSSFLLFFMSSPLLFNSSCFSFFFFFNFPFLFFFFSFSFSITSIQFHFSFVSLLNIFWLTFWLYESFCQIFLFIPYLNSSTNGLLSCPLILAIFLNSYTYSSIILSPFLICFNSATFLDSSFPSPNLFYISSNNSPTVSNSHNPASKSSIIFYF